MTPLFVDIETIPCQRADTIAQRDMDAMDALTAIREKRDDDIAAVAPPANYKDSAKRAEWMAAEGLAKRDAIAARADEAMAAARENFILKWRRTSLDGAYGQVFVVGFALGDNEPIALVADDIHLPAERDLLRTLWTTLDDVLADAGVRGEQTCWVGHNVVGFDMRFLFQRSVVHGVRPPAWLPLDAKPWDTGRVFDTMTQWAGQRDRVSLDKLCDALGVEAKGTGLEDEDIHGSKVWDFVAAGRIAEVVTYCEGDVRRARAIYQRMTFNAG